MKYKIELTEAQAVTLIASLNILAKKTEQVVSADVKHISHHISAQWHAQQANPTPIACILFPGDPSVGMFARSYDMELPNPINEDWSQPEKEELRTRIKLLYEHIDSDERCTVFFEGETD